MAETIKARVSNNNPLTGNTFPGEKHPQIDPDICFYKAEDNDKSDSGD